jgi:TonB-linked SusC/RagA family outer membrane protein
MSDKRILFRLVCLVFILLTSNSYGQDKNIEGIVSDNSGIPLPGVTVIKKGTKIGTSTDFDGNFNLTANTGEIIVFSYVGFKTKEVEIGDSNTYNIFLEEENMSLDEIVVVGYGTQKKSDIISSVTSVKSETINRVPSTDIGDMLKGQAAGVFITTSDAGPGSSSNILIRGRSSINGGNNPIVIVDGVPVGNINEVNANDIASIEILKDAAAQAIYGARASNGVILITTKRAAEGKSSVSYNGFYGIQYINRNFDVYSPEEYAMLKREAYRTTNGGAYMPDEDIFTPIELESLQNGNFIDWFDEVLQLAPIQNHNFNFSTGSEKTKVYSGLNYQQQDGVVPGTDFQRMIIRLNIDQKLNSWLSLGINTNWNISEKNDPGTGNTLERLVKASPLGVIYDENGELALNPSGFQESINPLLDLDTTKNLLKDRSDIMNIFFDVKPFKGFNYRMNVSRRSWNQEATEYSTGKSYVGFQNGGLGQGKITFQKSTEWQLENIINYDYEKNNHNLGLTFVQSVNQRRFEYFRNRASNLQNDILGIYGLLSAEFNEPLISASERSLLSFVGRAQYDYKNKYYLTASFRADGSSVFGDNNKWGYFPAVAFGWNIHKEDFMESLDVLNNLKLRLSYGSVGNEAIGPYGSLSTAVQNDYIFNDQISTGYIPGNTLPNPNLKWETSTTFNSAIDFGLWNNRLTATFEYYNTRTKDLLVSKTLNAALGYTSILSNIGEIENKGFEFAINGYVVDNKDFKINAGIIFSTNKNKIISLYGLDEDGDGIEDDDVGNQWFIGYPIGVEYNYQYAGIFQSQDEIDNSHQPDAQVGSIRLLDVDPNDGVLNPDDRVITKKDPDWIGTFNLDITYKNFDFTVQATTVQGRKMINPYYYSYNQGGDLRGLFNGIKQNYWTPENPTGDWPRPDAGNSPVFMNTLGLQDASFFRISLLSLGYTLPEKLTNKLNMGSVRLYSTARNPITITDYKSYSPDQNPNAYPEQVSVVFGLQVTF